MNIGRKQDDSWKTKTVSLFTLVFQIALKNFVFHLYFSIDNTNHPSMMNGMLPRMADEKFLAADLNNQLRLS